MYVGEEILKYTFETGEQIELDTPSLDEYDFKGFYLDASYDTPFNLSSMPNYDMDVFAKFDLVYYSIEFISETQIDIEPIVKAKDDLISYTLPLTVKPGYSFDGWFLDEELTDEYLPSKLSPDKRNISLYDKFSINTYELRIHFNDSQVSTTSFTFNDLIEFPEVDKEGYVLDGYYTDQELTQEFQLTHMPNYDVDLFPKFTEAFTINYILNDIQGTIEGDATQILSKGSYTTEVEVSAKQGYKFVGWSDGCVKEKRKDEVVNDRTYQALFEIDSCELPIIEISTKKGQEIISKDEYVKCTVSVSNTDDNYVFNNYSAKIKGRGNTTWGQPKKPYKLKFNDDVDLFGNGPARTWTLLAEYLDKSLIRNYSALQIGQSIGISSTSSCQMVELFLNGEYMGYYLVCEQNEVHPERINISDSLDTVDTGYLLEMEFRHQTEGVKNIDWFVQDEIQYVVKSPDVEDSNYNEDFTYFIKGYLSNCYESVINKDWDEITNYIDVESFAKTYIVNELYKSADIDYTSFYLYKMEHGKLYCGPLWDFDLSSGNDNTCLDITPTTLFVKETNQWYKPLLEVSQFAELVGEILEQYRVTIIETIEGCCSLVLSIPNSVNRNFERWKILDRYVWLNPPDILEIKNHPGQVEYLKKWLLSSLDYMYNYYVK